VYANYDRCDLRRSNIALKKVAAKGEGEKGSGIVRKRVWRSVAEAARN
jgi:hypothetical protein